jgi:hypothetical protein
MSRPGRDLAAGMKVKEGGAGVPSVCRTPPRTEPEETPVCGACASVRREGRSASGHADGEGATGTGAITAHVHQEQELDHAGAGRGAPIPVGSGTSAVSRATLPNLFIQYLPNGNSTLVIPERCLLMGA